jgi:hypothetical protein
MFSSIRTMTVGPGITPGLLTPARAMVRTPCPVRRVCGALAGSPPVMGPVTSPPVGSSTPP